MGLLKTRVAKILLILFILILLIFLTSSCKKEKEVDHSSNINTNPSENTGYLIDSLPTISYEYEEKLKIMEYESVKYYYFNDDAFFMVKESEKEFEKLEDDDIKSFFNTSKKDFSKKPWSKSVIIEDITKTDIPLIKGWGIKISMTYDKKTDYKSDVIIIYSNKSAINFTFLATAEEYEKNIENFLNIIKSIKPIN